MIYLVIVLSFILGFTLELIAQQGIWLWLQPEWVLLLIFYWLIYQPHYFGIRWCFLIGLIADIVHSSLLGKHAFIYVIMGFVIISFYRRIRLYHVWKLLLMIFFLTLSYLTFIFLSTHPQKLAFSTEILSLPLKAFITSLIWTTAAQFSQHRKMHNFK